MKKSILICPRCGSDKIEVVLPHIGSTYECKECGYRGPMIMGDKELAEKLKVGKREQEEGEEQPI